MDLQNLKEHYGELVLFMEKNGYSEHNVRLFREEICHILRYAESNSWESYRDIYLDHLKSLHSENNLRNKRTVIGVLEQFDVFGRFPDGRCRHSLFERDACHLLGLEFQEMIFTAGLKGSGAKRKQPYAENRIMRHLFYSRCRSGISVSQRTASYAEKMESGSGIGTVSPCIGA